MLESRAGGDEYNLHWQCSPVVLQLSSMINDDDMMPSFGYTHLDVLPTHTSPWWLRMASMSNIAPSSSSGNSDDHMITNLHTQPNKATTANLHHLNMMIEFLEPLDNSDYFAACLHYSIFKFATDLVDDKDNESTTYNQSTSANSWRNKLSQDAWRLPFCSACHLN